MSLPGLSSLLEPNPMLSLSLSRSLSLVRSLSCTHIADTAFDFIVESTQLGHGSE